MAGCRGLLGRRCSAAVERVRPLAPRLGLGRCGLWSRPWARLRSGGAVLRWLLWRMLARASRLHAMGAALASRERLLLTTKCAGAGSHTGARQPYTVDQIVGLHSTGTSR